MAREGGGEWYQSISCNKLSCRQVSFFGPKGTPSREEHKTHGRVLKVVTNEKGDAVGEVLTII
jgi:hypothetical protein